MLEKFDKEAQVFVMRAYQVAQEFGHDHVGTEHLLMSLAKDNSFVGRCFRDAGFTPKAITDVIEARFGRKAVHNRDLLLNDEMIGFLKGLSAAETSVAVTPWHLASALLVEDTTAKAIVKTINIMDKVPFQNPDTPWVESHNLNSEIPFAEGDFTEAANYALLFARAEAATVNFSTRKIDVSCLLVGLALERCGYAGKLMRQAGITVGAMRGPQTEKLSPKLTPRDVEATIFDSHCRRIIVTARKVCRKQGSSFVSTEHLLAAVLSSGQTTARKILAPIVEDLANVNRILRSGGHSRKESFADELEQNEKFWLYIQDGERSRDEFDGPNFNFSKLMPASLAIMEAAFNSVFYDGDFKFSAIHVMMGMLVDQHSTVGRYLRSWGLTPNLVRLASEGAYESRGRSPNPPVQEVDGKLEHMLNAALLIAKENHAYSVSPQHLFLALLHYDDSGWLAGLERIGFNLKKARADAELMCKSPEVVPPVFSPSIATISSAGLHIYCILCEPGVAWVMQSAANLAKASHLAVVDSSLLLAAINGVDSSIESKMISSADIDTTFDPSLEDVFFSALNRSMAHERKVLSVDDLYCVLALQSNSERIEPDVETVDNHNFSAFLRNVLDTAERTAAENGFQSLDTDILSLALAENMSLRTAQMLNDCGLNIVRLGDRIVMRGRRASGSADFSTESKKLAEYFSISQEIASQFGRQFVEPEHLMMALFDTIAFGENSLPGLNGDKLELHLFGTRPIGLRTEDRKLSNGFRFRITNMSAALRGVLVNATIIASESGRSYIDCEHVLVAASSCRSRALRDFLLDNGFVPSRLEALGKKYISHLVDYNNSPMGLSQPLEEAIDLALKMAVDRNVPAETEHLLLALLENPGGVSEAMLSDLGISTPLFRRALRHFIDK